MSQGTEEQIGAGRTGDDLDVVVIFFDEAAHSQSKLLVAAVLQPSKEAISKQGLTSPVGALGKIYKKLESESA